MCIYGCDDMCGYLYVCLRFDVCDYVSLYACVCLCLCARICVVWLCLYVCVGVFASNRKDSRLFPQGSRTMVRVSQGDVRMQLTEPLMWPQGSCSGLQSSSQATARYCSSLTVSTGSPHSPCELDPSNSASSRPPLPIFCIGTLYHPPG